MSNDLYQVPELNDTLKAAAENNPAVSEMTKPNPQGAKKPEKGTPRLIVGIIAIVMSLMILMQSCAVTGLGALVSEDAMASGMGGMLIAFLLLIAGIVDIATRKTRGKAGFIVSIAAYALAALCGFVFAPDYADLAFYAAVCLIFAAIDLVVFIKRFKQAANTRC